MKVLLSPRLWLALVSAAAVTWIVWQDLGRTSPGPVSTVHAAHPGIAAGESCDACHGGWFQSLKSACLDCHEAIAGQFDSGRGLHAELGPKVAACGACHREHLGPEHPLVDDAAFVLSGFPGGIASYDHRNLDFSLEGRHASLRCADCHPNADKAVLAEGERRFLGATQDCTACHDDPHEGRMTGTCSSCHGQEHPFAEVAAFEHDPRFPLEEAHAGKDCLDCHQKGTPHSVEGLSAFQGEPPRWRACAECHESPHREAFVAGNAALAGLESAAGCVTCHPTSHDSWRDPRIRLEPEQHAASGFPLEAPHAGLACADCHPAEAGDFHERYPGRLPSACEACHADPHGGQFEEGPFAGKGCLACHEPHAWQPPDFGAEKHALASFALHGAHLEVACEDCHPVPADDPAGVRRFRGVPGRCEECHEDAHRGSFDGRSLPEDPEGTCAVCHLTDAFHLYREEVFDHGRWTGFVLHGAHERTDCESCHPRAAEPDATGRRFGFVDEHFEGDPSRCATCHPDVHRGAFDAPGLPAEMAGREGCARCHGDEEFRTLVAAFDHEIWTGFELAGAHEEAECTACHRPGPASAVLDRRLGFVEEHYPGDPSKCVTCHADVHRGAFARAPAAGGSPPDCNRCHSVAAFAPPEIAFDHDTWTAFPLRGAHAQTACGDCHGPAPAEPAGRSFGFATDRYRGSWSRCETCHRDPHAGGFVRRPAAGPGGESGCAACHRETSFRDLKLRSFHHGEWTGFELDGAHAEAACSACHPALPGRDPRTGRRTARARGTDCASCHADPHAGQFARAGRTDCTSCHRTGPDFHALDFDHDRDSRFPLDEVHASLDCSACHRPWPVGGGREVVRYKPLGTRCQDCHAAGAALER